MSPERIHIHAVRHEGRTVDILIEGNRIVHLGGPLPEAGLLISGKGKVAIPGFINLHNHAAMTLLRGCGDDMPLMQWLEKRIWPIEAHLTHDDVYWGAKLACIEMIKSGTTTFVDGYHHMPATANAVRETGMRAVLSCACFDHFDHSEAETVKARIARLHAETDLAGGRIAYAVAPHAIYTVSGATLQWINDYAAANNILIQLHLAETESEVDFSLKHFGCSPVRYLHSLGVLSPRLLIAHGLYVDDEELVLLADHGVSVSHNPASNMKLASGYAFRFVEMQRAGIRVGIGTDGCSSSNNLDMIEAMKLASLLGKSWRKDPEILSATDVFAAATSQGADILGLPTGRIAEGALADIVLVDVNQPAFTPNLNFTSNLVYAANGSCVDTVICNGRILMQNRTIEGEAEVMRRVSQCAERLMAFSK
ncbi:MAG: amidohydrolase [Tannerellaceae bacterium]|jgi:5-methylthioadenosine/S-adenosylhomocysteine deaminase|nr:amidohydrolase [Tannerellaceae bacterium]